MDHSDHKDFHQLFHHLCCPSLLVLRRDIADGSSDGLSLNCLLPYITLLAFFFLDLGGKGVKSCYWELVILSTCLVVFLQPDTMTRKGTKKHHPNISSPTLFSQMTESNLCNKEYLFQSKEILNVMC